MASQTKSKPRHLNAWELRQETKTSEDDRIDLDVSRLTAERIRKIAKDPPAFEKRLRPFDTPVTADTLSRMVGSPVPHEDAIAEGAASKRRTDQ